MTELVYKDEVYAIIGAAMEAYGFVTRKTDPHAEGLDPSTFTAYQRSQTH